MTKNKAILRLSVSLGVLATTVLGTVVSQGASAALASDGTSQLVDYVEAPWPVPNFDLINDSNSDQLIKAAELIDFNKDDFAGSYVDPEGRVIVVASTPVGEQLANKAFADDPEVAIRTAGLTINQANQAGLDLSDEVPTVGDKIYKWGIDAQADVVRIGVFRALTSEDRAAMENFADRSGLRLVVYIDEKAQRPVENSRQEDGTPFQGGFRMTMQASSTGPQQDGPSCTGGFGYQSGGTNWVLTAGHCFYRNGTLNYAWNTYQGDPCCVPKNYIGYSAYSTFTKNVGTVNAGNDSAKHGDLALINVDLAGKNSSDHMWWGTRTTTNTIPVTARRVPAVGDSICINGISSGSDCGGLTIGDTNIGWTYSNGDHLINADGATSTNSLDCSLDGDSGGSVIIDHAGAETQATGVGIVSGSGPADPVGCVQIFTGIEEAIQAWGGNIKMN